MATDTGQKNIDLSECLARWIAKKTGLPIKVDFLAPDNQIGLIPNPGSNMLSKDMDGLEYWQYNYAITLQTKNAREANEKLSTIASWLNSLQNSQEFQDIKSKNNSWTFDDLKVNSAPAMTLKDVKGTVVYELDLAVFIYVQN